MRILIADGNSDVRHIMALILRHQGHLVDECLEGVNPEMLYKMHEHDVLALGDPAEETLDTINRLRRAGARVPVVMMSADEMGIMEASYQNHQGVVFLRKPFLRRELMSALDAAIGLVPSDW